MVLVLANQVQLTRSQSKDQVNLLSDSFKKKKNAPNKGNPGQIIETVILTIEQVELFEEIS